MFFQAPPVVHAEVFASVPDRLRLKGQPSSWIDANHPGSGLDCFLEGPAFDRAGNLYMVDIPFGRILRMHGPDGLAMDAEGNLAVAHPRVRILWLFDAIGAPLLQIHGPGKTSRMTNMAYGGADGKTLYIVDSYGGHVLTAPMPVAGKRLYSHS